MKRIQACILLLACLSACGAPPAPGATPIDAMPTDYVTVPTETAGRIVAIADDASGVSYQWPGVYFETAFEGDGVAFSIGPGDTILHLQVDGDRVGTLVKPAGHYRIDGLGDGEHVVRIEVATESQAGPNRFGGFWLPPEATSLPAPQRTRRIEFIGDSHTVGYGNLSRNRECSDAEVWATTDNTQAFGPVIARHYGADYRVNAISGRGVVRNYDGGEGDTLPQAYPYALFDHSAQDAAGDWLPQVVVIALGTNDFSTPLKPGERWSTREALQQDYVQAYAGFVASLRERYPQAYFVLWATDLADGEIRAQSARVVERLRQSGETRVGFVPVGELKMGGCHWHPSVDDSRRIADLLITHLDALPVAPWQEAEAR